MTSLSQFGGEQKDRGHQIIIDNNNRHIIPNDKNLFEMAWMKQAINWDLLNLQCISLNDEIYYLMPTYFVAEGMVVNGLVFNYFLWLVPKQ